MKPELIPVIYKGSERMEYPLTTRVISRALRIPSLPAWLASQRDIPDVRRTQVRGQQTRQFEPADILLILQSMQGKVDRVWIGTELQARRRYPQLEEVNLSQPGQEIIMNPGTEYRIVMEEVPTP